MTGSILTHLDVTNFRSIRGHVFAPLDAKVVLIHGENGAGKTSLLSAIELALTGGVQALRRADPGYASQLLHRGAKFGSVAVRTSIASFASRKSEVNASGIVKGQTLDEGAAAFFSERAYLPQSYLGQLLQIYQEAGSGVDSPLARFVGNLLGLDRLDALESGLQPLADVRNVRKYIDGWSDVEVEKKRLDSLLADQQRLKQQADLTLAKALTSLQEAMTALELPILPAVDSLDAVQAALELTDEESLTTVANQRRELAAIMFEIRRASNQASTGSEALLAEAQARASAAWGAWQSAHADRVRRVRDQIGELFPSAPLASAMKEFVGSARSLVEDERFRASNRVSTAQSDMRRLIDAEGELAAAEDQLEAIDDEMGQLARNSGALANALAEITSFVNDTDICPVCDRDYSERGGETLANHVHTKIRYLSGAAERLLTLGRIRNEAQRQIETLTDEIEQLQARSFEPEEFAGLQKYAGQLQTTLLELQSLGDIVAEGERLAAADVTARRAFTDEQVRNRARLAGRETLRDFALSIGQSVPDDDETIETAVERLEGFLSAQESRGNDRSSRRQQARTALQDARSAKENLNSINQTMAEYHRGLSATEAALQRGQRLREDGQQIRNLVDTVRSDIIRREFNDRLNRLWRDLFVRLAPGEPFVPAFRIPASGTRRIQPKLITEHRDGGDAGGTPGAMLSAGNLNTAALTLFIALHLSVPSKFPCLILDDPVQSMDDVHIAHFAALLRTLSKEHNRQVVIAVHDRQLFEYLKLELSPAYPDDSLLTLELLRGPRRDTNCIPQRLQFKEEIGLFAA